MVAVFRMRSAFDDQCYSSQIEVTLKRRVSLGKAERPRPESNPANGGGMNKSWSEVDRLSPDRIGLRDYNDLKEWLRPYVGKRF